MINSRADATNDVTLLTSKQCRLESLSRACEVVAPGLVVQKRGMCFEVTHGTTGSGTPDGGPPVGGVVLRVEQGRLLVNDAEVGRLVPGAGRPQGPVWWMDGQGDAQGVAIAQALVSELGGTCFVQDGESLNLEQAPAVFMGRFARVAGVDYHADYVAGGAEVSLQLPGAVPKPHPKAWISPGAGHWNWSVSWSEIERIYDVEVWGLDEEGFPVQVDNVVANVASIGSFHDVQHPYEDAPRGTSRHVREEQRRGYTQGRIRLEKLHDIRRIVHEHDLAMYSDPRSMGRGRMRPA